MVFKYTKLALLLCCTFLANITHAADYPEDKIDLMNRIVKAGSIAAKFKELAAGNVPEAEVKKRFEFLGDDILKPAIKWSKDNQLINSVPAFRRYLLFYYISQNTDVMTTATNPEGLRLNADSAAEFVFDSAAMISWINASMDEAPVTPKHTVIENHLMGVYPMIPSSKEAAQGCIECHAKLQVPYPDGAKVLGYTVVAIPL